MMEVLYKMFVEKYRVNCLLISKTEENAARLLDPYRQLRSESAINIRLWQPGAPGQMGRLRICYQKRQRFSCSGRRTKPRGARLEELRVTVIILDDVDDDEVCRNTDRLDNRWDWIERPLSLLLTYPATISFFSTTILLMKIA